MTELKENFLFYFVAITYLLAALPHPDNYYLIFKITIFVTIPLLIYITMPRVRRLTLFYLGVFWVVDNPLYLFPIADYVWVIYNLLAAVFFLLLLGERENPKH
jgi:hypothetical protein